MNDVICCIERFFGNDLFLLRTDLTTDQLRTAFAALNDAQKGAFCSEMFNVPYYAGVGSGENLRFYNMNELATITRTTSDLIVKLRLIS